MIVSDVGGPFIITFPNSDFIAEMNGSINVAWNVANTTASPFNTQNVKISLVTD